MDFLKALNTNKYYKALFIAGVLFIITGASFKDSALHNAGWITFLYGLFTWMISVVFYLKFDYQIPPKWKPIHFVVGYVMLSIIFFWLYVYLLVKLALK